MNRVKRIARRRRWSQQAQAGMFRNAENIRHSASQHSIGASNNYYRNVNDIQHIQMVVDGFNLYKKSLRDV